MNISRPDTRMACSPVFFVAIRYRKKRTAGGGMSRSPEAHRRDVRASTPSRRASSICLSPSLPKVVGGHCAPIKSTASRMTPEALREHYGGSLDYVRKLADHCAAEKLTAVTRRGPYGREYKPSRIVAINDRRV